MTTLRVLLAARALVERGWCQGVRVRYRSGDDGPHFCASGAIYFATDRSDAAAEALDVLSEAIGWNPVPDWNDAPGRTQQEVLAAFDRAIDAVRGNDGA